MNGRRWTVAAIVAGHFTASFAALGMPPFFPIILRESLHSDAVYLGGWCYVLPPLLTALSAPWWGNLSDRVGKKTMLLRAQLGLAASFLLAGFATNVPTFVAALALQGLLGGTFSASNAYLATVMSGTGLTRTLTLMQGSARAALFAGPALLGAFLTMRSPIEAYRWLALLPLASALLIWRLPGSSAESAIKKPVSASMSFDPALRRLAIVQFVLAFSTVATFPYFVEFARSVAPGQPGWAAGALFGLPHLVYLVGAAPLSLWFGQRRHSIEIAAAFLLLAASLVGQTTAGGPIALVAWRVLMGLAMTVSFIALHGAIAEVARAENAGRIFGRLDSSAKWGGVAAGLAAGALAQMAGTAAPFLMGAAVLAPAALYLLATRNPQEAANLDDQEMTFGA